MKVNQVTMVYGETRSVNFQSATIQVSLTADLETEPETEALQILEQQAKAYVDDAFDRYNERRVAKKLTEKARED